MNFEILVVCDNSGTSADITKANV